MRNSLESEDFKNGKVKLQFDWGIVGGSIDKNYVKPITDGFASMMDNGILAGYNIDSMKVRVYDGSMHAVDSKPIAFEFCAKEGFVKLRLKRLNQFFGAYYETGGNHSRRIYGRRHW